MAGSNETKAKSAQFRVKLPTGAELGNSFCHIILFEDISMYLAINRLNTIYIIFGTAPVKLVLNILFSSLV